MKLSRLALVASAVMLGTTGAIASQFTYAVNFTSAGTISSTTADSDSPAGSDNIRVLSGVTVESTGGNIMFNAADNITLDSGSTLISDTGNIVLNFDQSPTDGAGDEITLAGTLQGNAVTVTGGADSNTLNYLGPAAVLTYSAPGSGTIVVSGAPTITFSHIATITGNVTTTPEPTTPALLGLGIAGLLFAARFRPRRASAGPMGC